MTINPRYGVGLNNPMVKPVYSISVPKLEPEQMGQHIDQVLDNVDPTFDILRQENEKLKQENVFLCDFNAFLLSKVSKEDLKFIMKMGEFANTFSINTFYSKD